METKKAYYSAHALCDGTIWLAVPGRKPRATRSCPQPKIDEEGVYQWFFDKVGEQPVLNDRGAILRNVSIATCLNTRRLISRENHAKDRLPGVP